MKKTILLLLTSMVGFQLNAMEPLSDADLQQVEGQSGADLSLKLVLNQINADDSYGVNAYKFDNATNRICANVEFCRLALSVNNRYVSSGVASSEMGNKIWVVFKGIQGTINIQKLGLDGTDLTYLTKSTQTVAGFERIKPAIQLSYDVSKPIQIRNFGFDALSIELDSFTSQTNADGSVTENLTNPTTDKYGYLNKTTYSSSNSVYDAGKETGFMGMRMNGNLALQGKIMMFSCDASHPRC